MEVDFTKLQPGEIDAFIETTQAQARNPSEKKIAKSSAAKAIKTGVAPKRAAQDLDHLL